MALVFLFSQRGIDTKATPSKMEWYMVECRKWKYFSKMVKNIKMVKIHVNNIWRWEKLNEFLMDH